MNKSNPAPSAGKIIFTALFSLVALLSAVCLPGQTSLLVTAAVLALCAGGILLTWLPLKKLKLNRPLFGYTAAVLSGVLFFAAVEVLSMNMPYRVLPVAILLNTALITGIILLLTAITGRTAPAGIAAGALVLVLGLINHYTLKFRGTVVLPSDIFSVATAGQVVGNYDLTPDKRMCAALAGILLVFLLLYRTGCRAGKRGRIVSGCCALALLSLVTAVSASQTLSDRLGVSPSLWDQTARSKEIGFLLNGVENIRTMIVTAPEGYSREGAEAILAEHTANSADAGSDTRPNILVIMAESFAELQNVADFETNTGYLDNFYRIAQEPNSKTGKCVVSIFGGLTSCSEFEFLTGCSMRFLESSSAPYQQYIRSDTAALPACLRDLGYTTSALHPYEPQNWSRDTAYPLLGFQEFLSSASPEFVNAGTVRQWISDSALFDEMIARCEASDDPIFEFAITMQCHGGYTDPGYESTVELQGVSSEYGEVNQYLSLLKGTDEAIGQLIETLRASEEPTIVLLFGDHFPSFTSGFYDAFASEQSDSAEDFVRIFSTPYLFWANYDADFSGIPDLLSSNFLMPYLLKAAGIPLNSHQQYLYDLSQTYPVITKHAIIDTAGEHNFYQEGAACYEDLTAYQTIQYYFLFDSSK
ncbi:MAG: sulfatase-like hydrolase/transferase [Oscillospiraceae bacterium]|nr:sulfatase-like hydrolase/transferase [Oscillospiraceae bacterium]